MHECVICTLSFDILKSKSVFLFVCFLYVLGHQIQRWKEGLCDINVRPESDLNMRTFQLHLWCLIKVVAYLSSEQNLHIKRSLLI